MSIPFCGCLVSSLLPCHSACLFGYQPYMAACIYAFIFVMFGFPFVYFGLSVLYSFLFLSAYTHVAFLTAHPLLISSSLLMLIHLCLCIYILFIHVCVCIYILLIHVCVCIYILLVCIFLLPFQCLVLQVSCLPVYFFANFNSCVSRIGYGDFYLPAFLPTLYIILPIGPQFGSLPPALFPFPGPPFFCLFASLPVYLIVYLIKYIRVLVYSPCLLFAYIHPFIHSSIHSFIHCLLT